MLFFALYLLTALDLVSCSCIFHVRQAQWLFVRDRMRTYTGDSSGTTKFTVFLRKMKEKSK